MKKRFSEEQIIGFLKQAEAGMAVAELGRQHGFSPASFYQWRAKYGGMEAEDAKRLKELEMEGFQFEAADASFELMILKTLARFIPHFQLGMYRTSGEFPPPDGETSASAMLSIQVDGERETTAAMGNGPVNALDSALRKALSVFYPALNKARLTDYKVRVLTGDEATASKVRVLIESSDGKHSWTTVGVSTDIIAASWQALSDSIEYILHKKEGRLTWA